MPAPRGPAFGSPPPLAYRDHLSRIGQRQAAMPGRNVVLTYQVLF